MDAAYRKDSGASLYTVEAHVRYLTETGARAPLTVTTTIAGSAAKKLHLAHEMHSDGTLIATEELLALHVDSTSGRTSPFPDHITNNIDKYRWAGDGSSHQAVPPDWVGRSVSL
ncbi:thioesterase family protein [Arthrobacter pigmenti]